MALRSREFVRLSGRPAAHLPLDLGLSGPTCARSFPACHPRASHHTLEQCA